MVLKLEIFLTVACLISFSFDFLHIVPGGGQLGVRQNKFEGRHKQKY